MRSPRGDEGSDLGLRLRPHTPAGPQPLDKPSVLDRKDAEPVRANPRFRHEPLDICEKIVAHNPAIYTLSRASQHTL